ncbi:hypothetical protein [Streptomyces sp. NBC_00582]|uniref:hypothetical protein n=1 Tax=Streptomyces sp. NBC_00582 TaxID=2975783 RepID=UPI00106325C0|nr:hypothetical protein [Streptomyces sp. NBC_00582]WUB64004.1 hypothetical protein OG852_28220 [Streptomyces sp. NBC_00582]
MWNQISPAVGIVNALVAGVALYVCLKAIRLASASAETARRAAEDARQMRHMAVRHGAMAARGPDRAPDAAE